MVKKYNEFINEEKDNTLNEVQILHSGDLKNNQEGLDYLKDILNNGGQISSIEVGDFDQAIIIYMKRSKRKIIISFTEKSIEMW